MTSTDYSLCLGSDPGRSKSMAKKSLNSYQRTDPVDAGSRYEIGRVSVASADVLRTSDKCEIGDDRSVVAGLLALSFVTVHDHEFDHGSGRG